MKMKTKTASIGAIVLVGLTGLILIGCQMELPQPKAPDGLSKRQTGDKVEFVVKHISLFKQGVAFDILDTNQTRDATGVVASGTMTKVNQDILVVEKKPAKQSMETFLATLTKQSKKGCSYTIETKQGANNNKIHELRLPISCKDAKLINNLIYIYNNDNPEKIVKIQQANQYVGPRADKSKRKYRYESLEFL